MTTRAVKAFVFSSVVLSAPVHAAEIGKVYEITIISLEGDRFSGAYGKALIGEVVVMIPEGKVGEKYSVTVTDIRENGFIEAKQASCTFKQLGGEREGREGFCHAAPDQ